jgi:hypothetical protein
MLGYPVFKVPTEAPGPTSREAVNPQVGLIFRCPLDYLELFTRQSTAGPREVPELEVQERPPSTLRNTLTAGPREVPELEVQKCPPSMLRNTLMAGPREVPELEVRKLETWMTGPLRVLAAKFGNSHHRN